MPTTQPNRVVVTIVITFIALLLVNGLFYFLSQSYFESHKELVNGVLAPSFTPDKVMKVRLSFVAFSVVSSLFCIAAWVSPRNVGHGLAVLFGAANLVSLVRGLWGGLPGVLLTVWLISGVLLLVLAWFSYYRRARPAWSVLVALCAVLSLAELFGVPRFARAFDISLWLVMISPAIKAIAAGALIAVHSDYSEREPARTAAAAATA